MFYVRALEDLTVQQANFYAGQLLQVADSGGELPEALTIKYWDGFGSSHTVKVPLDKVEFANDELETLFLKVKAPADKDGNPRGLTVVFLYRHTDKSYIKHDILKDGIEGTGYDSAKEIPFPATISARVYNNVLKHLKKDDRYLPFAFRELDKASI